MVTIEQAQEAIILGDAYSFALTQELLDEQKKGCEDCCDVSLIESLIELTYMLERRITLPTPLLDETTDELYTCLQTKLISYSGAGGTINPNASIPNIIIDVEIIGNDAPYEITIPWSAFVDNGEDGRIRYENADWRNWLPMLAVDNMPFLVEDTDFEALADGGFELLSGGNLPAIYNGQVVRSVGYEPYVAPPIVVGVALIDNQSSISVNYQDAGGSSTELPAGQQFFKSPIVDMQTLLIQYLGTSLQMTVYNSNGSVFSELGPLTGSGLNVQNMDITKRYEIIITNL